MGDLITEPISSSLSFIPLSEFKRLENIDLSPHTRCEIFSEMSRLNTLYMIARAGSGHIGSSFSSMEIFSWVLTQECNKPTDSKKGQSLFLSSKGHDAPGYYAVQAARGVIPFDLIHKLRRIDGLPGHPDIGTPGVLANTGSLGMGVSKAKGMIFAKRLMGEECRIFVLMGDGELQEGQFWESLISAVNYKLHELIVIIDHNKIQSDNFVTHVSDLGDLEKKLEAFGWCVGRCDGNDVHSLSDAINSISNDERPKIIIADTVKGKGVSFMEHTSLDSDVAMYKFHSGAPDSPSYQKALREILSRIASLFEVNNIKPLLTEHVNPSEATKQGFNLQKLIPAYSAALIKQAVKNDKIVALDADLILDTGLIPFKDRYPERFFECGIAEQDMVSIAGGFALNGFLPIVHSFACFLSSRPNEQIYNNATEKTKIIYVGSLAGILPGGPGHSHQAVRDISALGGVPGLMMVEPSCEAEVDLLLDYCVNELQTSSYIRLVSIPVDVGFILPVGYKPQLGCGVILREGSGIAIVSAGPLMLSNAMSAAEIISERHGVNVKVINLPWLNVIDHHWLETELEKIDHIYSINNHYQIGGQADAVRRAISSIKRSVSVKSISIEEIPKSGANNEILAAHNLSSTSIANLISTTIFPDY
jgi:transketolase